jgi:hypothetical protein
VAGINIIKGKAGYHKTEDWTEKKYPRGGSIITSTHTTKSSDGPDKMETSRITRGHAGTNRVDETRVGGKLTKRDNYPGRGN